MKPIDQRGVGKKLKRVVPAKTFRSLTRGYNRVLALTPHGLKYGLGVILRRKKYPYCVIEDGDVIVQVGAPRDTLLAGRSRAIHFAQLVGSGVVVILEPDPANCEALRTYVSRHGLASRVRLVEVGAWSHKTELAFFSSDSHPAANVVVDVKEIPPSLEAERKYRRITIPVDTVDNVLEALCLGTPKLVSITTNGSEKQILEGMQQVLRSRVPYISLASTQADLVDHTLKLKYGYEYLARDDRGYCFRLRAV